MPDSSQIMPLPPAFYRRCGHGRQVHFERCDACDAEREAERVAEARRVGDPAQRVRDAVEARRPWFKRCAFCTHIDENEHDEGCPWAAALCGERAKR